jgi:hypothetical protein
MYTPRLLTKEKEILCISKSQQCMYSVSACKYVSMYVYMYVCMYVFSTLHLSVRASARIHLQQNRWYIYTKLDDIFTRNQKKVSTNSYATHELEHTYMRTCMHTYIHTTSSHHCPADWTRCVHKNPWSHTICMENVSATQAPASMHIKTIKTQSL